VFIKRVFIILFQQNAESNAPSALQQLGMILSAQQGPVPANIENAAQKLLDICTAKNKVFIVLVKYLAIY
jgi:hypothetical protein